MAGAALAVILARAGSKGVPGKNARLLAGRPMISYTIAHARAARMIERVVVSTDGAAIAGEAASMGVEVIDRPAELASDTARVDDAARHAAEASGSSHPIIVILYANVPVRPPGLIDRAVARLLETGADSVQSYTPVGKYHPAWMVSLDEAGRVTASHPASIDRRQDLPPLWIPDGGVIAVTRQSLCAGRTDDPHAFLGADRRGIESSPGSVIDIDTEADLALAAAHLARAETPIEPSS